MSTILALSLWFTCEIIMVLCWMICFFFSPVLFQCKFCGREGTVSMITGRGRPLTHEISQSGNYVPLMLFDCRGYEPVEFAFGSGWKVESVSLCLL